MSEEIQTGAAAPDFDLPTDGGGRVRLSDLAGAPAVVYFYPKDDTSGCTKEAIGFSERAEEFRAAGARVIGVSVDPVESHDKFKAKHGLDLTLASDTEKTMVQDYGVWIEKSMYGRTYMGADRATFLIGPDGTIARVWRKVKVPGHVDEVLGAVKAM